jgi:hypothetical protein
MNSESKSARGPDPWQMKTITTHYKTRGPPLHDKNSFCLFTKVPHATLLE